MSHKIKIQVSKENAKHQTKADLIDSLIKSLASNQFSVMTSINSSEVNRSEPYDCDMFHSLKRALPEGSDIRYGTVSHEPGMGGCYGEGYTIYLPEDVAPAIYIDSYYDDSPMAYINTEAFLESTMEVDETLQAAYDKFAEDKDDWDLEIVAAFIEHIGWHQAGSDNSCNSEHDLNSDIDFTVATKEDGADYIYDEALYFIRVHQGGDVRGNYSGVRVCRQSGDNECEFFDRSVGWSFYDGKDKDGVELSHEDCCHIDEHWQVGYSSSPTYQLEQDLECCKLSEDGTYYDVTLKDGSTGKIQPINYAILLAR